MKVETKSVTKIRRCITLSHSESSKLIDILNAFISRGVGTKQDTELALELCKKLEESFIE